jgi:hypothetical protein
LFFRAPPRSSLGDEYDFRAWADQTSIVLSVVLTLSRGCRSSLVLILFATFDIERMMDTVERAIPAPPFRLDHLAQLSLQHLPDGVARQGSGTL